MSDTHAISLKRSTALLAAVAFIAALTAVNFASIFSSKVGADQLQDRSLTLSSTLAGNIANGAANSETNGSSTTHTYSFTTGVNGDDATAVRFVYCTTAIGTCTTPTGLLTTSATISDVDGTGLGISSVASNGTIELDGGTLAASTSYQIAMQGITNPTSVGTFFVRIVTAQDDTFTPVVDDGTVASSITTGIQITTRVAETLGFSTTGEVDATGVPAPGTLCDPLQGSGAIQLGNPAFEYTLDMNETWDAWSAFRLFTNATNGVVVQYEGTLPTKGTDTIDSIGATATATAVGTEQFGLAIAPNADGQAGAGDFLNIDGTADWGAALPGGTPGALSVAANYGLGDGTIGTAGSGAQFAFTPNTPTTIAEGPSYVNCATGAVRYVGNVSPLTPSGIYSTTIVYSAVPTY